ncbi:glycosyltransferase family 2 protein [Photobacterium atrarenae]|uniref:Glycosyltransferase n=1 Tax=Photobacterium atrarenae TaxID=865757 RepID=A0ABY5GE26_9GAMM|nr:glycosyltransferase family 2 protein [Photobacterium atrarenae]UTV26979.1 glycosyltransferase [Photobacterium atrarenae]
MLISIITPTYNSSEQIRETYLSIKNQTYSNWEWLVTDDCSTDNTYDILKELSDNDKRIRIFRNEVNSGAAHSRNNSISQSNGHYLAFIDSDDLWLPSKLETQLSFMVDNRVDFSFTCYELIDESGELCGKVVDSHLSGPVCYDDMLRKKATLGCSTVMLKVDSFNDLNMPLIRTGQDYALWLKLLKEDSLAYPILKVLTRYRIMPNSISRNKIKKARRQWQIYRDIEKLSLFISIECFIYYAYRAVFRK